MKVSVVEECVFDRGQASHKINLFDMALYQIGPRADPWSLQGSAGDFLNEHVFYRELKGWEIDLARFQGALEAVSDDDLTDMFDQIPREWNNDSVSKVSSHLRSVRDHAAEFVNQVKWRLA